MKVKLENLNLNCIVYSSEGKPAYDVLALHGFTGSANDWNFLIPSLSRNNNVFALDLIGHGQSDSPDDLSMYSTDSIIEQINTTIEQISATNLILIGYSMGGRAALSYAVSYPGKVSGLILESTTWGIPEENFRNERIKSDKKLAEYILSNDVEKFVDYWMNLDLFATQKKLPAKILSDVRKNKLKNNKIGLANSLLGFGTGSMPPLHNLVNKIKAPALFITGEHDSKFTQINSEIKKHILNAAHITIPGAGHNVHLEKPDEFINVINNFLNKLIFL